MGCGWIGLKFFYGIKKTWQREFSFLFLVDAHIATSYRVNLPCRNKIPALGDGIRDAFTVLLSIFPHFAYLIA